jgi:hypothetical protein
MPLGQMWPDDSCVTEAGDEYAAIHVGIDENDNSVVLDFGSDMGVSTASARLRRRSLGCLIHLLQAAKDALAPGESDERVPDETDLYPNSQLPEEN